MRRLLAMILIAAPVAARPYRLPPETAPTADPTPAGRLTTAHCSACHSLDYIRTQPPGRDRAFWAAEVQKMIAVYGAKVPPDHAAMIGDYLAAGR